MLTDYNLLLKSIDNDLGKAKALADSGSLKPIPNDIWVQTLDLLQPDDPGLQAAKTRVLSGKITSQELTESLNKWASRQASTSSDAKDTNGIFAEWSKYGMGGVGGLLIGILVSAAISRARQEPESPVQSTRTYIYADIENARNKEREFQSKNISDRDRDINKLRQQMEAKDENITQLKREIDSIKKNQKSSLVNNTLDAPIAVTEPPPRPPQNSLDHNKINTVILNTFRRHENQYPPLDGAEVLAKLKIELASECERGLSLSALDDTLLSQEQSLDWYFLRVDIPEVISLVYAAQGKRYAPKFNELFEGFQSAQRDARSKATIKPAQVIFIGNREFKVIQRGEISVG